MNPWVQTRPNGTKIEWNMNLFRLAAHAVSAPTPLRALPAATWWSPRQFPPLQLATTPAQPAPAPGDRPGPDPSAAQEASQRLVAVQESVRRDMADYLHGHVQSKLLALSMSIGVCQKLLTRDPARAGHLLQNVQDELQRVQDEDVRQVSRELYPAIVKMGLAPAMRSLVSRFSDLLEIDLIIDAGVVALDAAGESRLPEKQRLGVYRIAEEALNNVLKHARAHHVEVRLACDASERLNLSVIDDGCGFDPVLDAIDCHGLVMMSDYAEAMGGKAEITSRVGLGTTVHLALPIGSSVPAEVVAAGTNWPHLPL